MADKKTNQPEETKAPELLISPEEETKDGASRLLASPDLQQQMQQLQQQEEVAPGFLKGVFINGKSKQKVVD